MRQGQIEEGVLKAKGQVALFVVGEEGKVVTVEGVDVSEPDDQVGEDKPDDTEHQEEEDGVVSVEPLELPHTKLTVPPLQGLSGHEALGQEDTGKGSPDVLALVRGADEAVSHDIVANHHEANDGNAEIVEVGTQQGNHKTSQANMTDVEDEPAKSLCPFDILLG